MKIYILTHEFCGDPVFDGIFTTKEKVAEEVKTWNNNTIERLKKDAEEEEKTGKVWRGLGSGRSGKEEYELALLKKSEIVYLDTYDLIDGDFILISESESFEVIY